MIARTVRTSILFGVFTLAASNLGQTSSQQRSAFEAATVKPFVPANVEIDIHVKPGGRVTANDVTLKRLISYAYGLADYRITGGPDWVNSDRWAVDAKAEDGTLPANGAADAGPVALMMQTLIVERFQLKTHREPRDLPTYALIIANGSPKIHRSDDQTPVYPDNQPPLQPGMPPPRGQVIGMTHRSMGEGPTIRTIEATAVPITRLVEALSHEVQAPVADQTGLQGLFDYKLQWRLVRASSTDFASDLPDSIFTAVQEQLGLRLVRKRGPVEVLVVDSVQKPPR